MVDSQWEVYVIVPVLVREEVQTCWVELTTMTERMTVFRSWGT